MGVIIVLFVSTLFHDERGGGGGRANTFHRVSFPESVPVSHKFVQKVSFTFRPLLHMTKDARWFKY